MINIFMRISGNGLAFSIVWSLIVLAAALLTAPGVFGIVATSPLTDKE